MMIKHGHLRGTTTLLAALLTVLLLAPVASAEGVGTTSLPGSNGVIAFVSAQDTSTTRMQVFRMNSDGFGQTRLSDAQGHNWDPTWSPDGKKIAFTNVVPNVGADIYQMDADGSDEQNLSRAEGYDSLPSYSPNGKIAFTSNLGGNGFDLYMMSLGTNGQITEQVRLTAHVADDSGAVVSPDGKRIAFTSKRDGDYDVYLMRAAPEGPKNIPVKLTKNAVNDYGPDWSPDGTQLVFNSNRSGNFEVYRMKVAPEGKTNRPVNLSKNPADDTAPTWSPDGKKIAFNSDRPGSDATTDLDIWRMRATDGANPTNLTDNAVLDFDPEWQPLP
ncbi:MAG: hypothetical protein M3533_12170 [Actinomycetota bacterium]|nr:hypothetical protein [Actinomycetota bacterium]